MGRRYFKRLLGLWLGKMGGEEVGKGEEVRRIRRPIDWGRKSTGTKGRIGGAGLEPERKKAIHK
jgi:hypothetical protein